jgi:hypothetical protein
MQVVIVEQSSVEHLREVARGLGASGAAGSTVDIIDHRGR